MKVTKRQLRRIIREAIDVINASTGEVLVFDDDLYDGEGAYTPDAPELAAREIIKRLKLTPLEGYSDGVQDAEEEIWLGDEDWAEMDDEIRGKRHRRKAKKELDRLNTDRLLDRLSNWAAGAGSDYMADNREFPETRIEDVAYDIADAWIFEFKPDEQEALLDYFDGNLNDLKIYAAESMG